MEQLVVEQRGNIAIITLNRPERRNALTPAMLVGLRRVAENLGSDAATRAVVIRGAGGDFSVGADLDAMGAPPPPVVEARRAAQAGALLMRSLRDIAQPTICAVHGIATGGAACIATACDFRIGAASARVGYGEVKLGINLMWHALPLAIQTVGLARAKRMVMTGDLFDAATLAEWGFFDALVPDGEQDAAALAMAGRYAMLPPVAVQMIKRSANAWAGALDAAIMHADADQWLLATRTADHREAVAAFRERRPGRFSGD